MQDNYVLGIHIYLIMYTWMLNYVYMQKIMYMCILNYVYMQDNYVYMHT